MRKTHSASRRALRAAAGLGAAVASLAFAGVASAGVQVISPDQPVHGSCPSSPPASSTLSTAIANATGASNTIVLTPGVYCPVHPSGQTTITIGHNLNIVADHSYQATGGRPVILVNGLEQASNGPLFTVPAGVSVRLDGFDFGQAGNGGGPAILNNGTLTTWGVMFNGDPGISLTNRGTAALRQTTVAAGLSDGIDNYGTMNLYGDSIVNNSGSGIDIETGSTTNAYNTLLANNSSTQGSCNFALNQFTNSPAPGSLSDDPTCGTQYSSVTGVDSYLGPTAPTGTGQANTNGGPSSSVKLASNPYTTGQGTSAYCEMTDQRFFVNPVVSGARQCDIGAVTLAATQQTTAPSCKVTGGTSGVSQQVTLSDSLSGIGPEPGLATDNPSNAVATLYPPTAAVPVAGYDVSNLQITNGSVSATFPTSPVASLVLTAGNKTTAGLNNSQWSFTGLNWAGVAQNCY